MGPEWICGCFQPYNFVPSFNLTRRSAYHSWVPQTNETHDQFVKDLIENTRKRRNQEHLPEVTTFSDSLTDDQKKLFESALRQVGQYYAKWADPKSIVTSWEEFLTLLDGIVRSAPQFYKANIRGVTIGEPIGVPLYLILDLVSNTTAAYTLFNQPTFNAALKLLLNGWAVFLKTPGSGYTLADQWFSPQGLVVLESGLGRLTFDETYKLELEPPRRYNSWDSFFTREFKDPSVRPIVKDPEGKIPFLYNACESTVLRTARNIQLNDTFWLKTQNYSLYDILGGAGGGLEQYAPQLVGGSVYQAFLSPQDYHRWHSPIKGIIEAAKTFDGTYYAVLPDDGAPPLRHRPRTG
jgi:phosphatidylserine decarboxylase